MSSSSRYVADFNVAGMRYWDGAKVISKLKLGKKLRLVAERTALDDVPDFFPEDDEDGKERPRMEHDVEEHARVL